MGFLPPILCILVILNNGCTLAVLSARQKSIISSDFVVWARVRRQIEVMLVKGNMGRCSKGKLWKKDIKELRKRLGENKLNKTDMR